MAVEGDEDPDYRNRMCFDFPSDIEESDKESENEENEDFGLSFDNNIPRTNMNDTEWLNKKLHKYTDTTTGEAIHNIMTTFIQDCLKKKTIGKILNLLNCVLPKPNNMPKTRYFFDKLLFSLLPKHEELIRRYRFCEDCSHYLGEIKKNDNVSTCEQCRSHNTGGRFIEYNIKEVLRNALEERDLAKLTREHRENEKNDPNVICDFTSGSEYLNLKMNVLTGDYDICLLWNTDGAPISNSSNGQIWPIQVQVINIPPQKRRSYQFTAGIFYAQNKPLMNSYLKPFTVKLKELYDTGINWFNKASNTAEKSIVIAPISTLDCPARCAVQNVMQFNGLCGCTFCEHPGRSEEHTSELQSHA